MASLEILGLLQNLHGLGLVHPGEALTAELGHLGFDGRRFLAGVDKDKFTAWFALVSEFDGWTSKSSCWHPFRRLQLQPGLVCCEQKVHPQLVFTRTTGRPGAPDPVVLAGATAASACRLTAAACEELPVVPELSRALAAHEGPLLLGKRYRFVLGSVAWEFSVEQSGPSLREALANPRVYAVRLTELFGPEPLGPAAYAPLLEKVRDLLGRPEGKPVPPVSDIFFLRARLLGRGPG